MPRSRFARAIWRAVFGVSAGVSDASESPEDEYAASDADASSDDYDVSRESRRGRRRSSGAR